METEENSSSASETEVKISEIDFKNFIYTKYNGLLTVLSDCSELASMARPLILAFHNFNKLNTQLEPWCNQIAETAKDFVGQVDFAIADFKTLSIGPKWNKFNYELLGPRARPRFFAFDLYGNQYRKDEFLSRETLKEFAMLLLKERLLISEPLPKEDVNNRVKIAVGSNLKELLVNINKDIFIVFYAEKNINSTELLSKLEELARLLQHEDLTVIKMKAEENHVLPDFNIVSYPKCFYIQKGNKNHCIQYEHQNFAVENLIEFIAAHSTKELECCDRKGMLKEHLRFKTELHLDRLIHIKSLVKKNHNDLVQVITKIDVSEKPLVVAFHNFLRFYDYLEPWCDIIEEVAKQFDGIVNFAIADISLFRIGGHKFERDYFTANICPWVFAFDKENKQYRFKELLSSTALEHFVNKLQRNELPESKLRPLYAIDPLVVGTEKNFNELVVNNSKDVFILFYVQWIYDSQCHLEVQEYLASLLQEDENQVIVKVDVEAEKPPPYDRINCFPTHIYVTNRHIENRRYWGGNIEDLIKFIATNSRHELKYYDREGYLRREYKRKSWIKPLQSILATASDENKTKEEETQRNRIHKLGNIITTSAYEGLLILRGADEEENFEVANSCAKVAVCRNLNEFVLHTNKDIFLVFYSHLYNEIRQVLNELAKLFNSDYENIVIAKMNTQSYAVPSRYRTIYHPKCIFVPKDNKTNVIEFNSQFRNIDSYIKFITAHSSMELTNYKRDGVLKKKLRKISQSEKNESIFHLVDAYDNSLEKLECSNYKQDVENFICKSEYNGLLRLVCPDEGENIKMFKGPLIVLVHNFKKLRERILIEWSATLVPVLQEFREQIKFYACDCDYFKQFQRPDKDFWLVYNFPDIYSIDSSNRIFKRFYENLMEFTLKTINNECFKSEPLPRKDNDEIVKKVVGHNFELLVLNNKLDVFVYIYNSEEANKILLPHAELFEDEEIIFFKIDGSKNYVPLEFAVGGYFFPKARRKEYLRFNNCDSLNSFIAFLSANATNELRNYNRKGISKRKLKSKYSYIM